VKHPDDLASNLTDLADTPLARELVENSQRLEQAGSKVVDKPLTTRIITISNQQGGVGKTTTTVLTWHICKNAGMDCAMVGNIGYSFARQLALDPKSLYVIEISSFQLDDIKTFRPDVAILTNITEDHLDRYDYKMQNYVDSKFRIVENQQVNDVFIFNLDDTITNQNINN
jgi:UDP-N-acetylmuramoylalanine--D-glutamate ligase